MKAVRCCDKHVQVVNVPAPSGAGVKINVRSAGICSSDLHMIEAGFELSGSCCVIISKRAAVARWMTYRSANLWSGLKTPDSSMDLVTSRT